jgi:adenylate kinase
MYCIPKQSGTLIFCGGVHGVGKTTFCRELAEAMHAIHISAGALLRLAGFVKPRQYEIPNPRENQVYLQRALQEYREQHKGELIILDGHFCLLTPLQTFQVVPYRVFESMNVTVLLVAVDDPSAISKRLARREGTHLPATLLERFQEREVARARAVSRRLHVPLREITPDALVADIAQWINTAGLNIDK